MCVRVYLHSVQERMQAVLIPRSFRLHLLVFSLTYDLQDVAYQLCCQLWILQYSLMTAASKHTKHTHYKAASNFMCDSASASRSSQQHVSNRSAFDAWQQHCISSKQRLVHC
jgi:hypothetical protein